MVCRCGAPAPNGICTAVVAIGTELLRSMTAHTQAHKEALYKDRKRAQRAVPITSTSRCARCGARGRLSRDHKDGNPANNAPSNLKVLCWRCHSKADVRRGKWGWRGYHKTHGGA